MAIKDTPVHYGERLLTFIHHASGESAFVEVPNHSACSHYTLQSVPIATVYSLPNCVGFYIRLSACCLPASLFVVTLGT